MIPPLLLTIACAGSFVLMGPQAAGAQGKGAPLAGLRGHCVFAAGADSKSLRALPTLRSRLDEHALAHGWSRELDGVDFVLESGAAPCTEDALAEIAAWIRRPERDQLRTTVSVQLAQALQRNGRAEQALVLLRAALEDARENEDEGRAQRDVSWISEQAARLAALSGRWEDALALAEQWSPDADCGNCWASESNRHRLLVARALAALGRSKEYRDEVFRCLESNWTFDPMLVESWIDRELELGNASTPEEAMRPLIERAPDRMGAQLDRTLESWRLAHGSREAQVLQLAVLAQSHPERALPLLLTLQDRELEPLLACFESDSAILRNYNLARFLAGVGLPAVGDALARGKAALDEGDTPPMFTIMEHAWQEGRERRKLLSPDSPR